MIKIKSYILNFLLSFLGLTMFSYFIWLRFIRERLPRDIPFNLTIFGFLILVYICCIYIYIILCLLLKNKTESKLISTLVYYIYKPLKTLDENIKTNSIIKPYYEKLLIYLSNSLKNLVTGHSSYDAHGYCYYYIYVVVQIVPRIILVSALFIDTFYFHKLNIFYKVIIIGLVIIIGKYIKYSFEYAQEQYIIELESMINKIMTNYNSEIEYPAYAFGSFLSVRKFLEVQVNKIEEDSVGYTYTAIFSNEYREKYEKLNNIIIKSPLSFPGRNGMDEEFHRIMEIVIPLSVHLDEYSLPDYKAKYKYIKALIFSFYLLCWGYILIISFHTLPSDSFMFLLDIIDKEDPFSVTIMNSEPEVNNNKSTDIIDKNEKHEEVD